MRERGREEEEEGEREGEREGGREREGEGGREEGREGERKGERERGRERRREGERGRERGRGRDREGRGRSVVRVCTGLHGRYYNVLFSLTWQSHASVQTVYMIQQCTEHWPHLQLPTAQCAGTQGPLVSGREGRERDSQTEGEEGTGDARERMNNT